MKIGLTSGCIVGTALAATAVLCAATLRGCPITHDAQARYRLLCEADHRVLVAAGREILAEVSQGNLKCGGYSVRDGRLSNGFRLPQAIADIQPRKVLVLEGSTGSGSTGSGLAIAIIRPLPGSHPHL